MIQLQHVQQQVNSKEFKDFCIENNIIPKDKESVQIILECTKKPISNKIKKRAFSLSYLFVLLFLANNGVILLAIYTKIIRSQIIAFSLLSLISFITIKIINKMVNSLVVKYRLSLYDENLGNFNVMVIDSKYSLHIIDVASLYLIKKYDQFEDCVFYLDYNSTALVILDLDGNQIKNYEIVNLDYKCGGINFNNNSKKNLNIINKRDMIKLLNEKHINSSFLNIKTVRKLFRYNENNY